MGALPTATTARTLHDPLPYCDAAKPGRRALIVKNARLAAREYEVVHIRWGKPRGPRFISERTDAGVLLNTCGLRRSCASNGPRASIFGGEDILIEHEEQALSDQTDLQPIPQPHPTLVDIWPKN
jgi:hypothetical protein